MNQQIWFTADQHLGHANIGNWTSRRFTDIADHDRQIVEAHNSCVGPKDTVYMLGDLSFHNDKAKIRQLVDQMNGRWVFVRGNHDHRVLKQIPHRFAEVHDYLELKHCRQHIVLCHYPLLEWNRSFREAWMLHGHSHAKHPQSPWKRMDVGVDTNQMKPWSFQQIQAIMVNREPQDQSIFE